jgi:hypothetical protein
MYRIARGNLERLEAERRRRVAANPATEPRNGTKNISAEASFRLVDLVIGRGLSVSEALRQVAAGTDGGEPETIGRTQADRVLRDERDRIHARAEIPAVAARILSLLSSELAVIERDTGPKDLERVHRIAQTLGTVERLRPKTGDHQETGLLSLKEQDPSPSSTPDQDV